MSRDPRRNSSAIPAAVLPNGSANKSTGPSVMGAISFSLDVRLLDLLTREAGLKIFFETGTFKGETLALARKYFPESHSVELSLEYYAAAARNFAGQPDVHLHQGESPALLRAHQARLQETPTLFWLDAHWCSAD